METCNCNQEDKLESIEKKIDKLTEIVHKLDVKLARLEERQSSQAKFWGFLGGVIPAVGAVLWTSAKEVLR